HPVEAGHAVHLVLGIAADEYVVAAFADHLVEGATTHEDVVADNVVGQERRKIVAGRSVLRAVLDPVIALVAGRRKAGLGAVDKIVALPAERRRNVLGGDDEVLAGAAKDDVPDATGHHVAGLDDVVAIAAFDPVVAAGVR